MESFDLTSTQDGMTDVDALATNSCGGPVTSTIMPLSGR
jgi:hypothetical protein